MKKASVLTLAFFVFSLGEMNGQVYFDKLYGDTSSADGIFTGCTSTLDNGYLVMSFHFSGQLDHHLLFVDLEGFPINTFQIENSDTVSEMPASIMRVDDTLFIGLSQWMDLSQSSDITGDVMLTGFSEAGTIHWRRKYGEIDRGEYPASHIATFDKGMAIVGQVGIYDGTEMDGQTYLMKIDSLGNFEWDYAYGGSNVETGNSLFQTPDSGFLLLGWTRSYGDGQRDFYLVKTDSVGNQEWQRTYGGSGSESGSCIIAKTDGNYLLCGGGSDTFGKLIKIDPTGSQIWLKNYNYPSGTVGNYLFKVIELPNSDIIAVGGTNNAAEGDAGWLLKTDSEGNEIWQRKYNKNSNTDLFYSVLLANDGGFLLSGQARNAETNSQDAWLLKVDSVGCPYPNCTVGVDETEKSKVVVDVWPNPASDILNLEFQHQEKAEYRIFDMSGKLLAQATTTQLRETIDVTAFGNGLYLLSIIQEEMKTTLKVVVQH